MVGTWVLLWLFKYGNHIEKIRTEDALNMHRDVAHKTVPLAMSLTICIFQGGLTPKSIQKRQPAHSASVS